MAQLSIERVVLEKLHHDAAAMSRLIGHIDDNVGGAAVVHVAHRERWVRLDQTRHLGDRGVRVAPGTTLIALLVLAALASAVIGGAP